TRVGLDQLAAAQSEEGAVLEHVEQFGLQARYHLPDLVEKEGPMGGQLEFPRFSPMGASEGPLLVAKELRFEQFARHARAVDLEERLIAPLGNAVNGVGHHFLAGAALPLEKD